jgi:hypothetical protein
VVKEGKERGITIRLIGGAAIASIAPRGSEIFSRYYKDADYFGLSTERKAIQTLMEEMGMEPNRRFNALHGYNRLMFFDKVLGTNVDVFLDEFIMCHKLILKDRLKNYYPSIPPSDLLLTKMQIINLTENDRKDIAALLYDFNLSTRDDINEIDVGRIVSVLSDDWGFYKTFSINHSRMLEFLAGREEGKQIIEKLNTLWNKVENSPKSLRWKLRAKVGEKVRWYEEPEEVNAGAGFEPAQDYSSRA